MLREIAGLIRCPSCGAGDFRMEIIAEDKREVREGAVICRTCKTKFPIKEGIVDLLYQPSTAVVQEIKAWESMRPEEAASDEERMRSRAWLRALPMLEGKQGPQAELETWRRHGRAAFDLCNTEDWRGKRVLELGAGRCWLSAYLARKGAEVYAVDILEDEDIGLGCAEAFLEEGVFFARILCDMHNLPFKTGAFHAVVATATLHHSPEPRRMFEEIERVLAPEGILIAANEPLYVPWREMPEEERRGAHEGSYTLWAWLMCLRRTGFKVSEVRVGRDASIHFEAAPSAVRGRVRPPATVRATAAYAAILALALPRLLLREARRMKAGRPMLPLPKNIWTYLMARVGWKRVEEEALAGEEGNWGAGWYPPEGDEVPFRWCGPRSRLLLTPPEGASTLVLELATFHPSPQSCPVHVEVRAGRDKVGEALIVRHGWRDYRFDTHRAGGDRPVPVTLRVKSGFFVPREMGLGDDERVLGVACRRVRWVS